MDTIYTPPYIQLQNVTTFSNHFKLGITAFFMVYTTNILCVQNKKNFDYVEKYVKVQPNACSHNGLSWPWSPPTIDIHPNHALLDKLSPTKNMNKWVDIGSKMVHIRCIIRFLMIYFFEITDSLFHRKTNRLQHYENKESSHSLASSFWIFSRPTLTS